MHQEFLLMFLLPVISVSRVHASLTLEFTDCGESLLLHHQMHDRLW
jgi:hypothetical protein